MEKEQKPVFFSYEGHLKMKSDVYSFGVVLLELLTGRRAHDMNHRTEDGSGSWDGYRLSKRLVISDIKDAISKGQYTTRAALKASSLAFRCTTTDSKSRPDAKQVVEELEQLLDLVHLENNNHQLNPTENDLRGKQVNAISEVGSYEGFASLIRTKSIVSNLSAKDNLWITWGSDARYWKWTTEEIGGECVDAAILTNVCWLELGGKYAINTELTIGMTHEVKLVVKVLDDCNINHPLSFSITSPDGCKHEHKENMMQMPRNQIIGITFGEFQVQESYGLAEVEFSMKCTDHYSWKSGMVVIGALVVPKF